MSPSGWSFWVKQGNWREVYWVAVADLEEAKELLLALSGADSEIEDEMKVDADTLDFLGLAVGEIARSYLRRGE